MLPELMLTLAFSILCCPQARVRQRHCRPMFRLRYRLFRHHARQRATAASRRRCLLLICHSATLPPQARTADACLRAASCRHHFTPRHAHVRIPRHVRRRRLSITLTPTPSSLMSFDAMPAALARYARFVRQRDATCPRFVIATLRRPATSFHAVTSATAFTAQHHFEPRRVFRAPTLFRCFRRAEHLHQ